jgi:hypothetical protein
MARPARTALQGGEQANGTAQGCVDADRRRTAEIGFAGAPIAVGAGDRPARADLLACAEGAYGKVVARRLHVTPGTVSKWRGRFITYRLDGLYDEPRPGAKRTITDDQVEQVIVRTLETTPRGATHWSTRDGESGWSRPHGH